MKKTETVYLDMEEVQPLSMAIFDVCDEYLQENCGDILELSHVSVVLASLDRVKETFILGLKAQGVEIK